jgi:hypothetical protein
MKRFSVAVLSIALAACGKSEDPQGGAVHDYSKPMLTDQNVANLIKAIMENKKVGEFMYSPGTKTADDFNAFDATAKKYGFAGRYEFLYVKSHCDSAESYLKELDMYAPMIAQAQEKLKKPDLTEYEKKDAEEQLARWTKEQQGVTKRAPDADIEVLKKHRAAFQQADKKARGN